MLALSVNDPWSSATLATIVAHWSFQTDPLRKTYVYDVIMAPLTALITTNYPSLVQFVQLFHISQAYCLLYHNDRFGMYVCLSKRFPDVKTDDQVRLNGQRSPLNPTSHLFKKYLYLTLTNGEMLKCYCYRIHSYSCQGQNYTHTSFEKILLLKLLHFRNKCQPDLSNFTIEDYTCSQQKHCKEKSLRIQGSKYSAKYDITHD